MTIRVAINGYGRIGRNILRAHYEGGKKNDIQIVAINDLGNAQSNAHLTRYDTAHGKFPGKVQVDGDAMVVNGDRIKVLAVRNPAELPWSQLGVDVVLECTGFFTSKEKASAHLKGGAKKVIISAPGGKDVDATVVYGVNHKVLKASHTVISNASCTTNCLAPLAKVLHETVGLVLPELDGKLDGFAVRVPTINVSLVDLTFDAGRATTAKEIDDAIKKASQGALKGVLAYVDEPLVSSDFNHNPASSLYDSSLTKVIEGKLVKVCSWYDNEWGFSNRMLDTTLAFAAAK